MYFHYILVWFQENLQWKVCDVCVGYVLWWVLTQDSGIFLHPSFHSHSIGALPGAVEKAEGHAEHAEPAGHLFGLKPNGCGRCGFG